MEISPTYWTSLLKELFDEAKTNGKIEYIYTLVRVTGIGEGPDKLISLKQSFEKYDNALTSLELLNIFREIVNCEDIYILLINLIRCASNGTYDSHPFVHLYSGTIFDRIKPTIVQIVSELLNIANKHNKPKLARSIEQIFPNDILNYQHTSDTSPVPIDTCKRLQDCYTFVKIILDIYFEERLKYKKAYKLIKCARFEVLELITCEDYGLCGFYTHFSNGTSAYFIRTSDNTKCMNLHLSPSVTLCVGDKGKLINEWRFGDKRLFEIGLPGRYNNLGEWMPIIYPGNADHLFKESILISNDNDVQGAFFYMLCTGHRIIEFVVRTTLELPSEFTSFGYRFHLWKCPAAKMVPEVNNILHIYDGWVELDTGNVEEIEAAIRGIGLALNIMGFTYNVPISWRIKYKLVEQMQATASPSKEDLDLLDTLLLKMPYEGNDALVLSYAIDWYVRGRTSKNIFMRFLSYYISLESVASAIVEGDADFGLGYHSETKDARKKRKIEGIKNLYEEFFNIDPIKFITDSYFEYVVSLKSRTRSVLELVFGKESEYVRMIFDKSEDPSLSDIRSKLAHGSVALFSIEDENLVRKHLYEIESISKEFLMRLILRLKPSEKLPSWSQTHKEGLAFVDPRSTLYCSKEAIIPETEWKIKSEWFD